jgi:peptidoglycan/LPS O-acetylase OafA/YrhL
LTVSRRLLLVALVAAAGILLPGLMLIGHFHNFSDTPAAAFLLVALAPLALHMRAIAPLNRRPGAWPAVVRLALVVAPVALGVTLAVTAFGSSPDRLF